MCEFYIFISGDCFYMLTMTSDLTFDLIWKFLCPAFAERTKKYWVCNVCNVCSGFWDSDLHGGSELGGVVLSGALHQTQHEGLQRARQRPLQGCDQILKRYTDNK